jgi:hypothetical protein
LGISYFHQTPIYILMQIKSYISYRVTFNKKTFSLCTIAWCSLFTLPNQSSLLHFTKSTSQLALKCTIQQSKQFRDWK